MPFKKLHADIKENLASLEIDTPTPFQSESIPVIKSGANVYCSAPKGSGKTTTLVLTTLHKLSCKPVGVAPRAFVVVSTRAQVFEMEKAFKKHTKYGAIRLYPCDEKDHIDKLKSEIFEGLDILIVTVKTLNKLLLMGGVNVSELKIFSVDDAEFLAKREAYANMISITQSLSKCQYVLYTEKVPPMLERFESQFMMYPKKITL